MKRLKCPHCGYIQKKFSITCGKCRMPLSPQTLREYADNLEKQWKEAPTRVRMEMSEVKSHKVRLPILDQIIFSDEARYQCERCGWTGTEPKQRYEGANILHTCNYMSKMRKRSLL